MFFKVRKVKTYVNSVTHKLSLFSQLIWTGASLIK